MSRFLRGGGGLHQQVKSFGKWKDLRHVGVEGCEGEGVLCNHSCKLDTYMKYYRVLVQGDLPFHFQKKTLHYNCTPARHNDIQSRKVTVSDLEM